MTEQIIIVAVGSVVVSLLSLSPVVKGLRENLSSAAKRASIQFSAGQTKSPKRL